MFRFPNHTQKLKAPNQPQSAGEESILTRDITQLLVQRFVRFHQDRKQLMFFQNIFGNQKHLAKQFTQGKNLNVKLKLFVQRFVKVFDQNRMHVEA